MLLGHLIPIMKMFSVSAIANRKSIAKLILFQSMPSHCFHKTHLLLIVCNLRVILTAFIESYHYKMCTKSVILTQYIFYVNTGRKEIRKDCVTFTAVDYVYEYSTSHHYIWFTVNCLGKSNYLWPDQHLERTKNLGRLWLAYTEIQGNFWCYHS